MKIYNISTQVYDTVVIGDPCDGVCESAVFQVNSDSKGVLITRLTTTQRDSIVSPCTGLLIYNTTTNRFEFYDGTMWVPISSGGSGSTGPTGPTGPTGSTGPTGPTGTSGPTGPTGPTLQLYDENPVSFNAPNATGDNAIALGNSAVSDQYGELSHSSGRFVANGDAQQMWFVLRGTTTNATDTEIFTDGATGRMVLPDNTCWTVNILITAYRTDAADEGAGYQVLAVILRNTGAASTRIIGSVNRTTIGEDNGSWNVFVDEDTTNGSLRIQVRGQTSKTVNWVARANIVQVTD